MMKFAVAPLVLTTLGATALALPQDPARGQRSDGGQAPTREATQQRGANQRGAKDAPDGMPDMPIARAGEEHKVLRLMEGDWTAEIKMNMGEEPMSTSSGIEKNRIVANGLWLQQTFEGNFFGMPFEGYGTLGYDADRGEYVGTWIDSMSSRISHMEKGQANPEKRTLVFRVKGVNPMTGEPSKERHTHVFTDKDSRSFTIEMLPEEGEPVTMMQVQYTRRTGREAGAGRARDAGAERGGR